MAGFEPWSSVLRDSHLNHYTIRKCGGLAVLTSSGGRFPVLKKYVSPYSVDGYNSDTLPFEGCEKQQSNKSKG